MDINKFKNKLGAIIEKYKYALLIFIIGCILMIIPGSRKQEANLNEALQHSTDQIDVEQQLEEILSYVQGAGRVKVMLKEIAGEETIYQTDIETG